VNAQKAYIRLGVGGGIGLKQYGPVITHDPAGGYNIDLWADETRTSSSDNLECKSLGLGGGLNANLAFGYMLSDYIGIELGVNQFIGLSKKINYSSSNSYGDYTMEAKVSGMMLQVVPAIVITPGLEKINPYARLGMIIGVLPSIIEKTNSTDTYIGEQLKATTTTTIDKIKLSGGIAAGFTAAGGVAFNLGEKLDFFTELVFNGITYAPSKGKYKEWTVDGVDVLASATTKQKEWTYEKKYNESEVIPNGNPDKQPKMSINFSNVELNIGIKLKL
jgi:hypothetical protein